jgi:hypothetical protein
MMRRPASPSGPTAALPFPGRAGVPAVGEVCPLCGRAQDDEAARRAEARDDADAALGEAMAVWETLLANGPIAAERAERERRNLGISAAVWRRARHRLCVETQKESFSGVWSWRLPTRSTD